MALNMLTMSGLGAMSGALLGISLIVLIGLYVYTAAAWYAIAKRLKFKQAWFAWVPILNLVLLPILAKKDWPWVFILLVPIVNFVFVIIWLWKIFERRKLHGAWSLLLVGQMIPFIGWLCGIGFLIVLGFSAWKK